MDELTSSPSPKPLKWVLLLFPFFRAAENEAGDVREPVRSQKESSINKIRKEEKKEGTEGERGMGREEMGGRREGGGREGGRRGGGEGRGGRREEGGGREEGRINSFQTQVWLQNFCSWPPGLFCSQLGFVLNRLLETGPQSSPLAFSPVAHAFFPSIRRSSLSFSEQEKSEKILKAGYQKRLQRS